MLQVISERLSSIDNSKAILYISNDEAVIKGVTKDLKIQALSLYEDFVKLEKALLKGGKS
jgi:hypothetical protein